MEPKLIVEQRISAFTNMYRLFLPQPDGTKGQMIAYAQQKRLSLKEKVSFYSDEQKTQLAFTFRAEKVMDYHGRFFVEDASGQLIGIFRKDFTQSLVQSTWHIVDQNDNRLLTIKESSAWLAVLRRFGGEIPFVGMFIELVTMLLRYHFVLLTPNNQQVGSYIKTTLFRDHYKLEATSDLFNHYDWRVLASLSVALDALQGR